MPIDVISAGIMTTIQDLGRPGYYHLGIPMGGAMDRFALRTANLLVGNDEGAAGLEAAFLGPELEFTDDAIIAVCGAELPPKIDGEQQSTWTALGVGKGQVLSFDFLRSGARAYIAVSGGIDTPPALGSRSTYPIGSLGGVDGRTVQPGDSLPLGQAGGTAKPGTSIPGELRRLPGSSAELRVLPGLYWDRITEGAQQGFFDDTWMVANEGPTGWAIASRAGGSWNLYRVNNLTARDPTLRTLLTRATRTDQYRCPTGRTHCAAPRCGLWRRLLHAWHGSFGRHGSHWPASAQHADKICQSGDGCGTCRTKEPGQHA